MMIGESSVVRAAIVFGALLFVHTTASYAAAAWYGGTIAIVQPYAGGFAVMVNTAELNDCQDQRVWVKDSALGEKLVDRLYSMALAAQASDRRVEFVIDKATNGAGGECEALGNSLIRTD